MFSKLLNIGTNGTTDFYQKREVKILNLLALIIILGLLIGSTNIFFLGDSYPAMAEGIIAILASFIILLNWKYKYETAAYTFVVIISTTLVFVNQYYEQSTAAYLYYFPVIFCVALLHNPNKHTSRSVIFFTIILAGFFFTKFIRIAPLKSITFTKEQNNLLFLYNIYFCIILTALLVYIFISFLNNQYTDLTKLLKKTGSDQVVISNSLKEKEILLAEVQHRVKNNLAVIIGLLNFQNETAKSDETKNALRDAKNRVMSIAMVHNQLYRKDDLTRINLNSYLSELITELLRSHPVFSGIPINKNMQDVDLTIIRTVPLGLIVNEVITNSFKHGFKDNKKPQIELQLEKQNDTAKLTISDNGIGFPPKENIDKQSLGLTLIESLTDQIDGKVDFSNSNGAKVEISFPLN